MDIALRGSVNMDGACRLSRFEAALQGTELGDTFARHITAVGDLETRSALHIVSIGEDRTELLVGGDDHSIATEQHGGIGQGLQ